MTKKSKNKRHQDVFDFYKNCSQDELLNNYNCFIYSYSHEPALIRLIAELRGIDTSKWKEFSR